MTAKATSLVSPAETVTGYAHPDYCASLAAFGEPRWLAKSRGWVLERPIGSGSDRDAMGCYPLFACEDWSGLRADLTTLGSEVVSLSLVTDPFGSFEIDELRACFPDKFVPFKEHFIADTTQPPETFVSKHHRYYAQRALKTLTVEQCRQPENLLDAWSALYSNLVARHRLTGIKAFSRAAFERQLKVPGLVTFEAIEHDKIVAAHLWYVRGEVAYSHLEASSPLGYALMASYALYWAAIGYFSQRVRWIDFGAGAGIGKSEDDGLARFKRGWSHGTRTAYFCGRILDHDRYARLSAAKITSGYFPAYRVGEF